MNKKTKKLNEQNNILDEKINKDNQKVFTDMICYLRGSNMTDYDIEVVRHDLTEMVLSAQQRGESIDAVIGNDYKEFCDEVIANIPSKTKLQKVVDYLDICCWGLSILFAINIVISKDTISIIENIVNRKPVDFSLSVSIGSAISIVFILLLANFIVNIIMKNSFSKEIKYKKTVGFVVGAILMASFLLIAWLGKGTLFTVNFFVACILIVILFIGHKFLEKI